MLGYIRACRIHFSVGSESPRISNLCTAAQNTSTSSALKISSRTPASSACARNAGEHDADGVAADALRR